MTGLPIAATYLGSSGCVPPLRLPSARGSCPQVRHSSCFPGHGNASREEHFIHLRLASSLNGEM